MKAKTILGSLDADLTTQVVSRRGALAKSGKMAGALALSSVPVAFGLMAKSAFAQTGGLPQGIIDVLNFALTLEYLEDEFYRSGLECGGDSSGCAADLPDHQRSRGGPRGITHRRNHSGGGTPAAKPNFDFTAGGTFPDPFTDYQTFQAAFPGLRGHRRPGLQGPGDGADGQRRYPDCGAPDPLGRGAACFGGAAAAGPEGMDHRESERHRVRRGSVDLQRRGEYHSGSSWDRHGPVRHCRECVRGV